MKLRNKKTGCVGDFGIKSIKDGGEFIRVMDSNAPPSKIKIECGTLYYYDTLAELNEEWEDYKPAEPLIKDEKIRKAIKYIFPKYALIHIEKQGGKRIFEFGGTRLEIDAPNENAIKHGLSYCIAELCGEEEE